MNVKDVELSVLSDRTETAQAEQLRPLLEGRAARRRRTVPAAASDGVVVGELVGFADTRPLVRYSGQPGDSAIEANTVVDMHDSHVGRRVVLMFERADPLKPIIMGWLRDRQSPVRVDAGSAVQIEADGQRLMLTAHEQLVLRCGSSSLTLTKAGKVLIQGKYISSRSAGVNRIWGGSVQIN